MKPVHKPGFVNSGKTKLVHIISFARAALTIVKW